MKKKIRVGILSNDRVMNTWQHTILDDIIHSDYAELELHIIIDNNNNSFNIPLSWKIYSKLDNFLFKPSPNALTYKIEDNPFKKTFFFSNVDEIETEDLLHNPLDVLVNFSNISPTKKVIDTCTYGVWHLTHTGINNIKPGPAGIWELILGKPEIEASLNYIAKGMLNPRKLDQTITCTDWISYSRNANIIYWQAYPLINRNLKRLYEIGDFGLSNGNIQMGSTISQNSLQAINYPRTSTLLWHSIKTLFKKIGQLIESQYYLNQWILLFNYNSDNSHYNLYQYKRILPPKDRFWADPFLIKRNGKYYLFIEELIYKNKLGHLAVMELDEKGNYTTPKIILKKDYHLSYPFIIEDQDSLYMIPETGSNNDIQLYKCTDFPYEWKLEKVLMKNVVAVDTTIYKMDGKYWMFTNLKLHKGMSYNVELFLFSSKELVSDNWIPHPLNPIVTDVKKSRPAGKLFKEKDKLIRPSQNCSHHYGYGMNMNMITKLNNSGFEEEIAHSISPNWEEDVLCTHTFNSCGNIKISDAQIKRRRFF